MPLPFSAEQFFGVFQRYNEAVSPLQGLLYLLALVALALVVRGGAGGAAGVGDTGRSAAVTAVLALLWLWMGAVYHLGFFRAINPAAAGFGAAFVLQGGLFLWYGVRHRRLRFGVSRDVRGAAGAGLVAYALVAYPLLGAAWGHVYPAAPTFGLPCPTTIFTLGLLLWTTRPVPWPLLVVPVGWAVVGTSAATQLGVREDFGLAVAALVVVAFAVRTRHRGEPDRPEPALRPARRPRHGRALGRS